ncbi:MAG TPA: hypothetical protein ENJ20_02430 [Bacteroidetes bacterium]|nr:hypothetical protein [Bacteroidota bacterium]
MKKTNPSVYHARGKLLLTAEYFVLEGALALALPVRYGQQLTVNDGAGPADCLHWQSFDEKGHCWFEGVFQKNNFDLLENTDEQTARRLRSLFLQIKKQNPAWRPTDCTLRTDLDFPRHWGLGTSSTLVWLLAKWAGVDPFQLQFQTFGGSGYDVACAGAEGPVLYQKQNNRPHIQRCEFDPPFSHQLYFVFLNKKQNSRKAISLFQNKKQKLKEYAHLTDALSELSGLFLKEKKLSRFENLIAEHENLIGTFLNLPRAKVLFFNDFWGEVKSLGAWGGDFVLVSSDRTERQTRSYFNDKGFDVFIPYRDMVPG